MNNSATPVTMAADNNPPRRSSPAADEPFMTLQEFLESVRLSYSAYRALREQGKTPKEIRLSKRTIRILRSEAVEWGTRVGIDPEVSTKATEGKAGVPRKPRSPRSKSQPRTEIQSGRFVSRVPEAAAMQVGDVEVRDFLVPLADFMVQAGLTADGYRLLRTSGNGPREVVRLREEVFVLMSDLCQWNESRCEAILRGASKPTPLPAGDGTSTGIDPDPSPTAEPDARGRDQSRG